MAPPDLRLLLALALALICAGGARAGDTAGAPQPQGCDAVEIFHRHGCPHCERALEYLEQLRRRHPGVTVTVSEVNASEAVRSRFAALNRRFGIRHPGVPSFLLCDNFLVGFAGVRTTGAEIERLLGTGGPATPAADAGVPESGRPSSRDGRGTARRWFEALDAGRLGLPLFTVAIGLIDGFNPCAMWVLLFLLSLLVNLRDRERMLLVAGTFVAVSGAVYFAFMAAWLNLFLVIGFSRGLQLTVGLVAIAIGVVHVKEFFAFGQGISLAIPEAAKPGLYARVRRVIYARNLPAALLAVTALAVLVNLIELLCTAGLPALYTQILTSRELHPVSYYGYLLLYNLAYILDDAVMVGIVVYTLNRRKLAEGQGRWLQLLSGTVIALLGLLLVFAPQWLF
jgi:glutaredoxin